MRQIDTEMGTTYLLGETVTDRPLQHPIGFIHFPSTPLASAEVRSGSIILDGRPTQQEMRDFWTKGYGFTGGL